MQTQHTRKQYIAWPTGQQDKVRARIEAHRLADEIAQGVGYREIEGEVRACAVGCSLDAYSHDQYSAVLGVDLRIARLVDHIHESLQFEDAVQWPGRVATALKPGADTTLAADRFMVWCLRQGACARNEHCARVAMLYQGRLQGGEPAQAGWRAAADAAADADADAAAAYAAAYAAYAAAYAADAADAADAYAAAYAAAANANAYARTTFWRDAASALIEILGRCEVPS